MGKETGLLELLSLDKKASQLLGEIQIAVSARVSLTVDTKQCDELVNSAIGRDQVLLHILKSSML